MLHANLVLALTLSNEPIALTDVQATVRLALARGDPDLEILDCAWGVQGRNRGRYDHLTEEKAKNQQPYKDRQEASTTQCLHEGRLTGRSVSSSLTDART